MVHSSMHTALQQQDYSFCKTEMNPLNVPIRSFKKDPQCQRGTTPPPFYQTPIPCENMMNSPGDYIQQQNTNTAQSFFSNIPVKASPSYKESDVQFDYPEMRPVSGQSCASLIEEDFFSDSFGGHPTMERQYSLTTVMEVIDMHNINDMAHASFSTPTQPIDILQRPQNTSNIGNGSTITFDGASTIPSDVYTVVAAPASDMRARNQFGASPAYSSVSNSPATGVQFLRYREDLPNSNQIANLNGQQTPPPYSVSVNPPNYPQNVQSVIAYQATEDLRSPSQMPVSPLTWDLSQQCNITSPAAVPQQANATRNKGNAFSFDDTELQPQPCPNLSYVRQNTSRFRGQEESFSAYPFQPSVSNPANVQGNQVDLASTSIAPTWDLMDNNDAYSPGPYVLEEVDHSTLKEEVRVLTEEERVDLRRIKNNHACRASRQRRKKRKAQKEALAGQLEDENKQLKMQIRQLEEEVNSYTEVVRRRMSQS